MIESLLQPGDVIFFRNSYKNPEDLTEETQVYVDHVGLFAGFDETGHPQIVHSITGSKGHYHPEKASGLCVTTLRALKNQIQEDGRFYDVIFTVFRSKFPEITEQALKILLQQATYRIPYDEQRLDEKLEREETLSGEEFMKLGMDSYPTAGIFRSIKYAARYPHPFTRTRGTGVGRGLTCSMSVILAYQVAELHLDGKVSTVNPFLNEWPSDKYGVSSSSHPFHSDAYSKYVADLRKKTVARKEQKGLKLSIHFWRGDSDPKTYCHKTFPLDCKVVGAEGMFFYMQSASDAWEYMGDLEVVERRFKFDDKLLHKQKLVASYQRFINIIQSEVRKFPITCSPAPSPEPIPAEKSELWWNKDDINAMVAGAEALSLEELEAFQLPDLNKILSHISQRLISSDSHKKISIALGFLLNQQFIHFIITTAGSKDTLPTFYPNKEACYNEIMQLGMLDISERKPTILFYPSHSSPLDHTYYIFLRVLFQEFIQTTIAISEEQKIRLIKELTALGKEFYAEKKPIDAVSMYQVAQLIYCLLEKPTRAMHEQMLQLFLLKIQAINKIADSFPKKAYTKGEEIRALDLLAFIEKTQPEDFELLCTYPVTQRVMEFRKSPSPTFSFT